MVSDHWAPFEPDATSPWTLRRVVHLHRRAAFAATCQAAKLSERVALLAFSEFGRTIRENGSGGTDHGTAGVVLLAGPSVRGGLAGNMPSLTDLGDGAPKMTTDFRRIYTSVLESWLGISSRDAVGGSFEPVALFRY
jgi:uncharacterized protein (DUF1501 family)